MSCSSADESVVFLSKDTGVSRIYEIHSNKEIALISLNNGKALNPTLSPDMNQLAYLSEEVGAWDIRVRDLNSGVDTNITRSNNIEGPPAWSPDGKSIAFMSLRNENRDIFIHDLENGNLRQVTFNEGIDVEPVWSQSMGNTLYFKSLRSDNEEIYQISLNDSLVRRISLGYGSNSDAQIIPTMSSISYVHYSQGMYQLLSFSEINHEMTTLLSAAARIQSYHWSSDGKYLALDFVGVIEIYIQTNSGLTFVEEIENGELPRWTKTGTTLFYNLNDDKGAQVFKYDIGKNIVKEITPIEFNAFGAIPLK